MTIETRFKENLFPELVSWSSFIFIILVQLFFSGRTETEYNSAYSIFSGPTFFSWLFPIIILGYFFICLIKGAVAVKNYLSRKGINKQFRRLIMVIVWFSYLFYSFMSWNIYAAAPKSVFEIIIMFPFGILTALGFLPLGLFFLYSISMTDEPESILH